MPRWTPPPAHPEAALTLTLTRTLSVEQDDVARLHAAPGTGVVVVTGGGSGALPVLLTVPGASRTLLEARIPYTARALQEWLGATPDRACDPETARAMAMVAYRRALQLDPEQGRFGVACTASLVTDRPKRGEHRVHVALQTEAATHLWSLVLDAGARSRAEEEALCVDLILNAVAEGKNEQPLRAVPVRDGERLVEERHSGSPQWQNLIHARARATHHVLAHTPPTEPRRRPVFPGAFNPVHDGHLEMARIAAQRIGAATEFEICVVNVDKPPLNYADIARRTARFHDSATIWLTAAPTFVEKAELFPEAVFVVGIDTLVRIAEPRYYRDDAGERDAAMARIGAFGCSFLVFGRVEKERFLGLDDVTLPASVRALCEGIDEANFRMDMSSSHLRRQETSR